MHFVGEEQRTGLTCAWESSGTLESYAAYRLGALRWFGGGLLALAVAVGLASYAVLGLGRPGLGPFILVGVLLGVIGLGTGGGGLLRARNFRHALQRAPWRRAELRVAGAHLRLVFSEQETRDVRLMATSRWRVREVVGHRDSAVLVCERGDSPYILTAEGTNNLYGLSSLAVKPRRNSA